LEKGKVYTYQNARALLNPLRRLTLPADGLAIRFPAQTKQTSRSAASGTSGWD
jgi:hypothetical protein